MIRKAVFVTTLSALILASVHAGKPIGAAISGDYVEIRSSDVYTGPCFANAEVGLTGKEAVLTWAVRSGEWKGVPLEGLSVIAAVRTSATLGDEHNDPYPAKAVVIVDQRADALQRDALISFARHQAGRLLADIVQTESAPIEVAFSSLTCPENGCATVRAEGLVEIQTRCLNNGDHVCGNETAYFPPLTDIHHARTAFTEVGQFTGVGLGVTFDEGQRRSAYLGMFGR